MMRHLFKYHMTHNIIDVTSRVQPTEIHLIGSQFISNQILIKCYYIIFCDFFYCVLLHWKMYLLNFCSSNFIHLFIWRKYSNTTQDTCKNSIFKLTHVIYHRIYHPAVSNACFVVCWQYMWKKKRKQNIKSRKNVNCWHDISLHRHESLSFLCSCFIAAQVSKIYWSIFFIDNEILYETHIHTQTISLKIYINNEAKDQLMMIKPN